MAKVLPLMQKVLVWKFYRDNTAFFLLVIVLCFGFLSGREHVALAEGFIGSYVTSLIPISAWFLYTLKVIRYNYQSIGSPVNAVLQHSHTLKPLVRLLNIVNVAILQLLPVAVYGAFVLSIAVAHKQFQVAAVLMLSIVILLVSSVLTIPLFISRTSAEHKTFFLQNIFNRHFSRPLIWVEIEYAVRKDPFMVLSTKIFSCILISATCSLYNFDEYDWRLLALGGMLAFSGNMILMGTLHTVTNRSMIWLRNMPFTLKKRFFITLTVITILSIPETVAIFRNLPTSLHFVDGIAVLIFGVSFQVLFYSVFYRASSQRNRSHYLIMLVTLQLILFKTPLWVLTTVNICFASLVYARNFYEYEHSESAGAPNS